MDTEQAKQQTGSGFAGVSGYAPQRWSAEEPKAAGWWWWTWDSAEEPLILPVTRCGEAGRDWLEVEHPYGWMTLGLMKLRFPGMRWAGPLPVPLDAPDAETGHIQQLGETAHMPEQSKSK